MRGAAGNIRHVVFDHLGSVGALFDGSALVANSLTRFDPFGNFRGTPPTTNPNTTDHGYTGHRHNNTGPDLGLIYMNARYYLPEVGRFISPDTIVPEPENPQSYNRYAYVLNSPVNYTDPSGHCFVLPPFDTAACAIAAGASISAGTMAGAAAAFTALAVAAADLASPDFNPVADLANLIGDAADDAQQLGQEIMRNLAGPSSSGDPGDFDPNDPDNQSRPEWERYVKEEYRNDLREAFDDEPQVIQLEKDTVVFRHHGSNTSSSSWYSPKSYTYPGNAQRYLALPKSNPANAVSRYIIPKGTNVLYGRAANQVPNPFFHENALGGGMQYYVPDPSVVIPY